MIIQQVIQIEAGIYIVKQLFKVCGYVKCEKVKH
jgi:hypothetical protein